MFRISTTFVIVDTYILKHMLIHVGVISSHIGSAKRSFGVIDKPYHDQRDSSFINDLTATVDLCMERQSTA